MKRKSKKLDKKSSVHKKDCNIEKIKACGKDVIDLAISCYKTGLIKENPYKQILLAAEFLANSIDESFLNDKK